MKLKLALLLLLWPLAHSYAQPPPILRPLSVGDTLPDIALSGIYNYPSASARLSDFHDKIILLDFWATWCGSCIESFPEMQVLQEELKNDVQVLLVNTSSQDNESKVASFLSKRRSRTGQTLTLPYILLDSVLKKLFPHYYIPHYVWLDRNRKVMAVTDKKQVSLQNLRDMAKGISLHLPVKDDALSYDPGSPLKTGTFLYRSIITPYSSELGGGSGIQGNPEGKAEKIFAINYSLYSLFQMAWPAIFKYPSSRTILGKTNINLDSIYCYEAITPPVNEKEILQYMQDDLSRNFRVNPRLENRMLDCFVLKPGQYIKKSLTKGMFSTSDIEKTSLRKYIQNEPVNSLTNFIAALLPLPVMDETGLRQNIDIEFPYGIYELDTGQLKRFLATKGFELIRSRRMMEVAVISSK